MAREAVWLKMVPRAMAEGLTGGRSREMLCEHAIGSAMFLSEHKMNAPRKEVACTSGRGEEEWSEGLCGVAKGFAAGFALADEDEMSSRIPARTRSKMRRENALTIQSGHRAGGLPLEM